MTRVAALDCGTNTLRLLVADLDPAASDADVLDRRTTIVRLGQDVDRTGVFADAALERTFRTLDEYRDVIVSHDVEAVRFVATSAARDVRNRDAFAAGVKARVGVDPEVISGDEEARLAFGGATRQLAAHPEFAAPVLVLDIGGGSTELVLGQPGAGVLRAISLDIGSVRLTERHLHSDPPRGHEVAAVVADIDAALDTAPFAPGDAGTLVGVAGSVLTMGAMVLDLAAYERERVNLARLDSAAVLDAVERMVAMTVAERTRLPYMHPDRADVIAAGALILGRVVVRLRVPEVVTSARDILDGIAWSLLR